jgi:hypothetical protein
MNAGDLDETSTAEQADAIDQLHGLMTAAHSQLLDVVAHYDRNESWAEDGATCMVDWLVARLSIAHRSAKDWVRVARALEDLPGISACYSEGRLSFDQLVPLTKLATPDTDQALAEQAPGWSVAQLELAVRRAKPVTNNEANDAHRRRYLRMRFDDDRSFRISGRLADAEGAVVEAALAALANAAQPDPATGVYDPFESRLADALVEMASTDLAEEADADRASVVIHMEAEVVGGGEGGAEIEDGPAISAETARRLACDSRWQLVAEEAGQALGVGRRTRQVPRWLSRQLRRRDGGCRFPGCARKRWLHAHHILFWGKGGPTDPDNLVMLCGYHHRRLHEGGWRIEGDPEDELRFVNPQGKVLSTRPAPLRDEVRERVLASVS